MQNCWEFKKCGREHGGSKSNDLGVCPAAVKTEADGYCGGKNGGRGCAYIAGTLCGGDVQGNIVDKQKNCFECDFYQILRHEHGVEQSVVSFGRFIRGSV